MIAAVQETIEHGTPDREGDGGREEEGEGEGERESCQQTASTQSL